MGVEKVPLVVILLVFCGIEESVACFRMDSLAGHVLSSKNCKTIGGCE